MHCARKQAVFMPKQRGYAKIIPLHNLVPADLDCLGKFPGFPTVS